MIPVVRGDLVAGSYNNVAMFAGGQDFSQYGGSAVVDMFVAGEIAKYVFFVYLYNRIDMSCGILRRLRLQLYFSSTIFSVKCDMCEPRVEYSRKFQRTSERLPNHWHRYLNSCVALTAAGPVTVNGDFYSNGTLEFDTNDGQVSAVNVTGTLILCRT